MRCYIQDPLEHALAGVRACGRRGYSYYVGICSDPLLRWSEGVSRHSDRFDGMIVVSDAATASLEERVIAACQGSLRCLNVGRGGSAGTPESVGCTSRTALMVSCGATAETHLASVQTSERDDVSMPLFNRAAHTVVYCGIYNDSRVDR